MDILENRTNPKDAVAAAINGAEEFLEQESPQGPEKPRLLVDKSNPDQTVAALRDHLAQAGVLYDRGLPVRVAFDKMQEGMVAQVLSSHGLILEAHRICRPYAEKLKDGVRIEVDVALPTNIARMYLDWRGEWGLRALNGHASTPLLQGDGTISSAEGYDAASGMWCENTPEVGALVPALPSKHDAERALRLLRTTFRTFCFADAETLHDESGVAIVDTSKSPGRDESAFLAALLTAVCRPSLHLAPGVLLRAPTLSGAGAGKGLLARCMCSIAFGREPHAVTGGGTPEELEKRIAAELIGGGPVLFLDNLNNTTFRSDLLASAIAERPARVRLLGKSQMVPLNASAFVILTGNGLTVSEDLARRFIEVELDPRTEDPEARPFTTDIRKEVSNRRCDLLAALLTIWRWGCFTGDIKVGRPLGSFEQWCSWVRDPLLALGCHDPVERVSETKQRDAGRQAVVELFTMWWARHGDRPVRISELHPDVQNAGDIYGQSRQFVSAYLEKLAGTRMAGFALTRQAPVGDWGRATYRLVQVKA
jgi:hypothetical protein